MEEQPYFIDAWLDPLVHALNEYAVGDGAALFSLLRGSPRRLEYRTILLATPAAARVWQVPHCEPPAPVRSIEEVHHLIRTLVAQEAAAAAVGEISSDHMY